MKVFLSWSGERSKRLASALADWLPRVIQELDPWMSDRSISAGKSWHEELEQALNSCDCAIICVTPENTTSPWLLFEAGALSRAYRNAIAIPLYYGLSPAEATGPLSQRQGVPSSQDGLYSLVKSLNARASRPLPTPALDQSFAVWWPKLSGEIQALEATSSSASAGVVMLRRVLFAVTHDFQSPDMLAHEDLATLERCFPGRVTVQSPTSLADLSAALTSSKFDIVHLLAMVQPATGKMLLGDGESLRAEGLRKLLEKTDAKFIFLATCDSLVLAAEIARSLSVVAAFGTVKAEVISSWQRTFYHLLSIGRPLSEAYEVARSSSDQPIVLLTRSDSRFLLQDPP
jgi:hypothetical protein